MGFKEGHIKLGGRVKGTTNLLTTTVKERVLEVFNKLQNDPKANLYNWALSDPKMFYLIAAKLIPTEVTNKIEETVFVEVRE